MEHAVDDVAAAPEVVSDAAGSVASRTRPGTAGGVGDQTSPALHIAAGSAEAGNRSQLNVLSAAVVPEDAAELPGRGRGGGGAPNAFRRPSNTTDLNIMLERMFRVVSEFPVWDGTPNQRKAAWTRAKDVLVSKENFNQKWVHLFRNLRRWDS